MSEKKIKPVLILPKGEMSAPDVRRLRDNGICVVEATDPSKVRFAGGAPVRAAPSHLELGTDAKNQADKRIRGRAASGDRNGTKTHPEKISRGDKVGTSKLTTEQVIEIRAKRRAGVMLRQLAAEYGTVKANICDIVYRRSWRHLP